MLRLVHRFLHTLRVLRSASVQRGAAVLVPAAPCRAAGSALPAAPTQCYTAGHRRWSRKELRLAQLLPSPAALDADARHLLGYTLHPRRFHPAVWQHLLPRVSASHAADLARAALTVNNKYMFARSLMITRIRRRLLQPVAAMALFDDAIALRRVWALQHLLRDGDLQQLHAVLAAAWERAMATHSPRLIHPFLTLPAWSPSPAATLHALQLHRTHLHAYTPILPLLLAQLQPPATAPGFDTALLEAARHAAAVPQLQDIVFCNDAAGARASSHVLRAAQRHGLRCTLRYLLSHHASKPSQPSSPPYDTHSLKRRRLARPSTSTSSPCPLYNPIQTIHCCD